MPQPTRPARRDPPELTPAQTLIVRLIKEARLELHDPYSVALVVANRLHTRPEYILDIYKNADTKGYL